MANASDILLGRRDCCVTLDMGDSTSDHALSPMNATAGRIKQIMYSHNHYSILLVLGRSMPSESELIRQIERLAGSFRDRIVAVRLIIRIGVRVIGVGVRVVRVRIVVRVIARVVGLCCHLCLLQLPPQPDVLLC